VKYLTNEFGRASMKASGERERLCQSGIWYKPYEFLNREYIFDAFISFDADDKKEQIANER
jgi:hypothetical protein